MFKFPRQTDKLGLTLEQYYTEYSRNLDIIKDSNKRWYPIQVPYNKNQQRKKKMNKLINLTGKDIKLSDGSILIGNLPTAYAERRVVGTEKRDDLVLYWNEEQITNLPREVPTRKDEPLVWYIVNPDVFEATERRGRPDVITPVSYIDLATTDEGGTHYLVPGFIRH